MSANETEWELAKENFQPLKSGRKPGILKVLANIELEKPALEAKRK